MSHQGGVSQWIAEVSSRFGVLTPPQARTLAYWSYGMVLTQSCGLTTIATFLATLLGTRYDAQRQQLREWCYDARDQRGTGRREVDVSVCFAPLLGWVLALWPPSERRLALALDATTLGQRFTVLAISVVYRGCAIPVAWHVVPATAKGRWRPHWERLLTQVGAEVPADWLVIVLADRGLYARWLFQAIVAQDWHPCPAHQPAGAVSPDGPDALPAAGDGGLPRTGRLEGHGRLFCQLLLPFNVHLARPVDGTAHRSLADPDRSAAGGRTGRLVWDAGVDRVRV